MSLGLPFQDQGASFSGVCQAVSSPQMPNKCLQLFAQDTQWGYNCYPVILQGKTFSFMLYRLKFGISKEASYAQLGYIYVIIILWNIYTIEK